ncbi:uncharacterized protein [Lepisosteus oculatus]|uniref:uncharacterized protein n=1 Tax=Lepisosteus oculatus TaxID=7918 RepID=UPI0035F50465
MSVAIKIQKNPRAETGVGDTPTEMRGRPSAANRYRCPAPSSSIPSPGRADSNRNRALLMMGWVLLSAPLWAGQSSAQSGTEETKTLLLGEDLYIPVPTNESAEVLFQPGTDPDSSRALMAEGRVLEPRCLFHNESGLLVLRNITAADSGVYLVRLRQSWYIANITVVVRDCFAEHLVQTGGSLELALTEDVSRLLLEFEPLPFGGNETLVLLNRSQTPDPRYRARVSVGSRHWSLHAVTAGDQGVYIVRDWEGRELDRVCLVVRGCSERISLSYRGQLLIPLEQDWPAVLLEFEPLQAGQPPVRVLLDRRGGPGPPPFSEFGERLSLGNRSLTLHKLTFQDQGQFRLRDAQGRLLRATCLWLKGTRRRARLGYKDSLTLPAGVSLLFRPRPGGAPRLLARDGAIVDRQYAGRLALSPDTLTLARVTPRDQGVYEVRDLEGNVLHSLSLEVEPFDLPPYSIVLITFATVAAVVICASIVTFLRMSCGEARRAREQPGQEPASFVDDDAMLCSGQDPESRPAERRPRREERKVHPSVTDDDQVPSPSASSEKIPRPEDKQDVLPLQADELCTHLPLSDGLPDSACVFTSDKLGS